MVIYIKVSALFLNDEKKHVIQFKLKTVTTNEALMQKVRAGHNSQ